MKKKLITIILLLFSTSLMLAETRPGGNTGKGLFVKNGNLYDANGCLFVPRGVNTTHGWLDYGPDARPQYDALDEISSLGFNSIRIVWGAGITTTGWSQNTDVLRDIIEKCIDQNMVPMLELHDGTGSNSPDLLFELVDWYIDNASWLNDHEEHLIINIANEWGKWDLSKTVWRDTYKTAITRLRNAGIKAPLVIDGRDWAKNIDVVKDYGQELVDHDPQHNIAFGQHFYCGRGQNGSLIETDMDWAKNNDICLMVGEFAVNLSGCDVDEKTIVRVAEENGQGWYYWAWVNGGLSLASKMNADSYDELTWEGKWLIFDSPYGVKATSKKSSSLTGGLACSAPPAPDPGPIDGDLSGVYYLQNRRSGLRMRSPENLGGNISQGSSIGTGSSYRFRLTAVEGKEDTYTIESESTGFHLSPDGGNGVAGVPVELSNDDGTAIEWKIYAAEEGFFHIESQLTEDGTLLKMRNADCYLNQGALIETHYGTGECTMWRLIPAEGANTRMADDTYSIPFDPGGTTLRGTFYLRNRRSGLLMQSPGNLGGSVRLGNANGTDASYRFRITPLSGGTYTIESESTGFKLRPDGGRGASGVPVELTNSGGTQVEWRIYPAGDGYFYLESELSSGGNLLKMRNNDCFTNQGTVIETHTGAGECTQWRLLFISGSNTRAADGLSKELSTSLSPSEVSLYPNPAEASVVLKARSEFSYTIRDLVGKTVRFGESATSEAAIDVSGMQSGIYLVTISDEEGKVERKLVVK